FSGCQTPSRPRSTAVFSFLAACAKAKMETVRMTELRQTSQRFIFGLSVEGTWAIVTAIPNAERGKGRSDSACCHVLTFATIRCPFVSPLGGDSVMSTSILCACGKSISLEETRETLWCPNCGRDLPAESKDRWGADRAGETDHRRGKRRKFAFVGVPLGII